jgi:tellurite resistance protein TehA-like permease
MEEQGNIIKQEENMDKQGKTMEMDNKMMMLMMLGCMGMALLFYAIPSGWLAAGIGGFSIVGIGLVLVMVFACCIPMMKMMMGGSKQDDEA